MSIYDSVESMLLCRGEELFPFCSYDASVDWRAVARAWDVIIGSYDRFMTPEEILKLYDEDP